MLKMVGFDGDDTLWRSEDYYRAANAEFSAIVGAYVDLDDAEVQARMLATERRNLALFGYGAKGMTLSMVETAIALSEQRIGAPDIERIMALGRHVLQHPVVLLPGIRAAVATVAARYPVVLITKGDLFHQERKVAESGLADQFRRIEIVSEKNPATYRRLLDEFGVAAHEFAMVGNSLRSDIEPVVRLGGWGVHMPYHVTWAHELDTQLDPRDAPHVREVAQAGEIPAAVAQLDTLAYA
ncbi:MAG TPA: HAD family hydrolase [Rhodanobacter sp.]|nr:HAD family hydrolase [Rhodanobacter sp.]